MKRLTGELRSAVEGLRAAAHHGHQLTAEVRHDGVIEAIDKLDVKIASLEAECTTRHGAQVGLGQEINRLHAGIEEQEKQLYTAQHLLAECWETDKVPAHDKYCPRDDSCRCDQIERFEAAMKGYRPPREG